MRDRVARFGPGVSLDVVIGEGTMRTHAVTLHETNSRAIVPVCCCGWIGCVHCRRTHVVKGLEQPLPGSAHDAALAEYQRHLNAR